MTQRDRDRLVVLKKAQKKLITQKQAAAELGLTERHMRRLLRQLNSRGDEAVIHALRGRPSNRKLSQQVQQKILAILAQDEYRDFGPTAASEELANRHQIRIGREALRQLLIESGRWRAKKQKVEKVHQWRQRRSCRGELVQWDTSEHDWLEGRGDKLYLIAMIDDATSELTARFAWHDSTEENMLLLRDYLEKNGRPIGFYTDKASLFQTAPKVARDQKALARDEREPLPPTQIGRALQELQIAWVAAHSPQANQYLQMHFLPWWNQTLKVAPANAADAHRALGPDHDLRSALSHVESRTVANDYTFRYAGKLYQIAAGSIRQGLRGGMVRVELRLDGSLAVRFAATWIDVSECQVRQKVAPAKTAKPSAASAITTAQRTAAWRRSNDNLFRPTVNVHAAAAINRTRTQQKLD